MKVFKSCLLIFVSLLLAACYDLSFPAGSLNDAHFDDSLIGTWKKTNRNTSSRDASMIIEKDGDKSYRIHYSDSENINYLLKAHVNVIAGANIITLRHPNEERSQHPQYAVYRYSIGADGVLDVAMMKVSNPQFSTQSAFQNFLKKNQSRLDTLFEDSMYFAKQK